MSRRGNVLLVTWDGAGNLPPERALVRALVARGHTVRAIAHESARDALEQDGAAFSPLRGAHHYDSQEPVSPEEEMPFVVEHIWNAEAFDTELSEAVAAHRPDVLLVDVCLVTALLAARRSGIPTAVLCHTPYGLIVGPFAPMLGSRLPGSSHQALIESLGLVVVASHRPFDEVATVAPNVVHVGPMRRPARGGAWPRRMPERPLVLVGLSTSQQHQLPLLERLCAALGELPVEALVTTGPAIAPEALHPATNTTVQRFVSHDEVLPSASLLVTHAGHGTVMAGTTYGVPILCLPMGRDQPLIAERVARLGLGAVGSPEASVGELRGAIAAVLADSDVAARAKTFARSLEGHAGLDEAIARIERLGLA